MLLANPHVTMRCCNSQILAKKGQTPAAWNISSPLLCRQAAEDHSGLLCPDLGPCQAAGQPAGQRQIFQQQRRPGHSLGPPRGSAHRCHRSQGLGQPRPTSMHTHTKYVCSAVSQWAPAPYGNGLINSAGALSWQRCREVGQGNLTPFCIGRGAQPCAAVLQERFHLKHVFCWHSLYGYWAGIDPASPEMQQYRPSLVWPKPTGGVQPCASPHTTLPGCQPRTTSLHASFGQPWKARCGASGYLTDKLRS